MTDLRRSTPITHRLDPVSTGLIVLAVVVFLVIDGAILFLVFRSRRTG